MLSKISIHLSAQTGASALNHRQKSQYCLWYVMLISLRFLVELRRTRRSIQGLLNCLLPRKTRVCQTLWSSPHQSRSCCRRTIRSSFISSPSSQYCMLWRYILSLSLTSSCPIFGYLNQNYSVLDYHNLHRVRAKEACEGTIKYGVQAVGLIISLGFPVTGVL